MYKKWELFKPFVLLIVGGVFIFSLQQKLLVDINRVEKRLDRKYTILTKVSSIPAKCYQEIWNLWHGVDSKEPQENRIKYREKLQTVFVEANSVAVELPVLFENQNIATDWDTFLKMYQAAEYPITRQGISQEELNNKLDVAKPYYQNVVKNISLELTKEKKVLFLGVNARTKGSMLILCALFVIYGTYLLSRDVFEKAFKKEVNLDFKDLPLSLKLALILFGDVKKFKNKELWIEENYPTSSHFPLKLKTKLVRPFIGFIFVCIGAIGAVYIQLLCKI